MEAPKNPCLKVSREGGCKPIPSFQLTIKLRMLPLYLGGQGGELEDYDGHIRQEN